MPTVPRSLLEGALWRVPGAAAATGVDPATVPYVTHPTSYVCPNTVRDLAGTGVACPPLAAYADRLVAYLRENPDRRRDAMA